MAHGHTAWGRLAVDLLLTTDCTRCVHTHTLSDLEERLEGYQQQAFLGYGTVILIFFFKISRGALLNMSGFFNQHVLQTCSDVC